MIKLIILLILSLGIYLPYALLDSKPLVIIPNEVNASSLSQAKNLMSHITASLNPNHSDKKITINFSQLEALLSLASHTFKPLSARFNDLEDGILISASVKLPASLYFNLQTEFSGDFIHSPSSYSRIGNIELSNQTLITAIKYGLSLFLNNAEQQAVNNMIQSVSLNRESINIQIHTAFNIAELSSIFESKANSTLKLAAGSKVNMEPEISHYLSVLQRLEDSMPTHSRYPLALHSVATAVFSEAAFRSQSSSPQHENKAALIALALFVGDSSLRRVIKTAYNLQRPISSSKHSYRLRQRGDLVLHFLYSAIIKVIADNHISFALGELKEISDSGKGGSGFSFVDLLADRAGTQFASVAIDSRSSAVQLQKTMSVITSEQAFFPSISGLREGLSKKAFKQLYGSKNSSVYQKELNKIDRRINALAIYN